MFFIEMIQYYKVKLSSLNDKHSCQLFRMILRDKTTPTLTTPLIREWLRLLAAECYSGLYEEGGGEINLFYALSLT